MNGIYAVGTTSFVFAKCKCGKQTFALVSSIAWHYEKDMACAELECFVCKKNMNISVKAFFNNPLKIEFDEN